MMVFALLLFQFFLVSFFEIRNDDLMSHELFCKEHTSWAHLFYILEINTPVCNTYMLVYLYNESPSGHIVDR